MATILEEMDHLKIWPTIYSKCISRYRCIRRRPG
jgi:hypothetical protein